MRGCRPRLRALIFSRIDQKSRRAADTVSREETLMMEMLTRRPRALVLGLGLAASIAIAAAQGCGGGDANLGHDQTSSTTGAGGSTTASTGSGGMSSSSGSTGGSTSSSGSGGASSSSSSSSGSGGDLPDGGPTACASPFTVPLDPNGEAKATAALQALSPTATLTWAPVRGTIASIAGLVVPLPSCTGTQDVYGALFDVLTQSPDLFQIDPAEWHANGPVQCDDVLANGFHTLVIHRDKLGPYTLENDVFSVVADVQNGTVILRNFSGTYIPRPSPELLTTLAACPDLPDADAKTLLLAKPFQYLKFAPSPAPACTAAGTATYTASAGDTLTIDPNVALMWEENAVLQIRRQRSATLVVASANYTPALQNSDANCQTDVGPNIGWIRTFDAVTGEILYDHGSPDPYCIVC
jgi:hypothetical protein